MNISISNKEFEALCSLIDQVLTDAEAASDEEYLNYIKEVLKNANKIVDKYFIAKAKYKMYKEDNAKIKKIMKEHPFETRGMSVAQVKRLIYRN